MSNRCLRPLAALATIVYLTVPCKAQPYTLASLRGEVRSEQPTSFHEYRIELEDVGHRTDTLRADLNFDGAFELRNVSTGEYLLRVTTLSGNTIHQEFVTVNPQTVDLSVRLPRSDRNSPVPGTISLTQLRHPPNRKAIQSFVAAQRFAEKGSPEKAAEELEKAVRISPEFADAYTNLAVQHIRLRRFQEAADELTRAIEIAGPDPIRLCNLAFAQANLNRIQDSLASARAALRLDSGYPQAHLILGSILAANPRTRAEAIPHLKRAAETIPSARATLQKLASSEESVGH